MHVSRLAADEGFVNLDFTAEATASEFILHGKAYAMKHEPCSLLGDSESAMDFPRRDAILAVANEPDARQPLLKRQWRILKDGSGLDRELPLRVTSAALPAPLIRQKADLSTAASRAYHAIRPSLINEVVEAIVGIGKDLYRFDQGEWLRNVWHGFRVA